MSSSPPLVSPPLVSSLQAYYAALKGLPAPCTRAVLLQKVKDALVQESEAAREMAWTEILTAMHEQATEVESSSSPICLKTH